MKKNNTPSKISSHKWITTEATSTGRTLVTHKVDQIYQSVGASQCNLISIFGRARQGKSFLMNCLAGEEQIFRISNDKESCTQGIDISEKWLSVSDFSRVDGGVLHEGKLKIGFVDAEGQGDRDVSYDANLVCPILLASKCVIFNWKGEMQKDDIINKLGIMTRAAKNVALSAGELASGKKIFGHLHIVFRDWQATDRNSNSIHQFLFGLEKNQDGAIRDQIRKDVLSSFESVKVSLFDAPSDSMAVLRTELTIEKTSAIFRKQVRELRGILAAQLKAPMLFAGKAMTGRSIGPLVNLVADSLNRGETVLPHSAYVTMMKSEIDQVRQKLEVTMRSHLEKELRGIAVTSGDFLSEDVAVRKFIEVLDGLVVDFNRY